MHRLHCDRFRVQARVFVESGLNLAGQLAVIERLGASAAGGENTGQEDEGRNSAHLVPHAF